MPAAVKDSPNKIFVSNMPKTWNEGKFESVFVKFGKISDGNENDNYIIAVNSHSIKSSQEALKA